MFLAKYLYKIRYMMLHKSSENVGKNPKSAIENKGSILTYICYPAKITYGKFNSYNYFILYDKKNELATTPLSMVDTFKRKDKLSTEKEIRKMKYRLLNRALDTIENSSDIQCKNKRSMPKETNYDAF